VFRYKLIASRGNAIVFDDRIQTDTPRNARREMKNLLGLQSLSGIVYSITEIPVALIREIFDSRIAELAGGAPIQTSLPLELEELVMERLKPILGRCSDPSKTAFKYANSTAARRMPRTCSSPTSSA
jgi:hypothetical protein